MNIWAILLLVMALSFIVQAVLNRKINKYGKVTLPMTGAEVAAKMLADNGLNDVSITQVNGKLTDHYNPADKTVNLSREVYSGRNLAAAAVAAHECGHAVQHATGYAPLQFRSALVPIASFASKWVQWILLAGVIVIEFTPALLYAGIVLFATTTLFSLVTLPVEINASRRATEWLDFNRITSSYNSDGEDTTAMARDALKWAAMTYVIAAIGSLATLFYYIAIARER
ncbi:MAG: zinc metallopeptidase [Bacteroidales bacterium]|nr:zinc metallopeptidase [Bacteroidales bacterium]